MMWQFLKLIFRRWIVRVLFLLGLASAFSIYFSKFTLPSWVSTLILLAALLLGACDVYKQTTHPDTGQPKLVIHPFPGSRYIPHADRNDRSRILGTFIELHLAVENKGDRNSNINRCDLFIRELDKTYPDIKPQQKSGIQGKKSFYSIGQDWLMPRGVLTVESQKMTEPKKLLFYLSERIPSGHLQIRCTLTLCDTDGKKVSGDFELLEA